MTNCAMRSRRATRKTETQLLAEWLEREVEVRFTQALNRLRFGTADPTGGSGRQSKTFDCYAGVQRTPEIRFAPYRDML
jgi:hypothetical protein